MVLPDRALDYFQRMAPELYRFPAVDPRSFARRVEETFGGSAPGAPSGPAAA